jgi:hypothetical protein
LFNNNPDYFCIIYKKEDINTQKELPIGISRFAAQMYANKMNIRLQEIAVKISLTDIAKMPTGTLNVDSHILFPLKTDIRRRYFIDRHLLVDSLVDGSISREELQSRLKEIRESTINKVCGGLELCKNAVNYSIDRELLPMKGVRERFSYDIENPYHRVMPRFSMRIDMPSVDSSGRKIIEAVSQITGARNYFAEKVPESGPGQIPNFVSIKKAYNTVRSLRENKVYKAIDELAKSCKQSERTNMENVRRKISYLMYAGDNDIFFEYFGFIRDFQLKSS